MAAVFEVKKGIPTQAKEKTIYDRKLAVAPAGKLLFALALTSYVFWLLHSFAIRTSFTAVHGLLLKSGLKP
jgi:predicted membrane protein